MTNNRECGFCENVVPPVSDPQYKMWRLQGDDATCPDCLKTNSQAPININEVLTKSRSIDTAMQVRTDIFNAETVAIAELKKAIDSDDTITNKPYTLALEIHNRRKIQQALIFDLGQKMTEATSRQNAQQIYLNTLSNQLRAEEREKLKVADINYKPRAVKTPVTAKTIRQAKKRIDKVELRNAAAKLGIAEFTLNMVIISKNLTVQEAYDMIKAGMDKAKSVVAAQTVVQPVVEAEVVEDMTGTESN